LILGLFNETLKLHNLCSIKWLDVKGVVVVCVVALSLNMSARPEETHKTPQSGQQGYGLRTEHNTFRIQSRTV